MEKYPDDGTQFAVHAAYQDLLELISTTTPDLPASDRQALARELRDTVLGLIGAVLGQTEGVQEAEAHFFQHLLALPGNADSIRQSIQQYAGAWKSLSRHIPRFFSLAAQFDRQHATGHARSMLARLQLISNNAAIADGATSPAEHRDVREYIKFLEHQLDNPTSRPR